MLGFLIRTAVGAVTLLAMAGVSPQHIIVRSFPAALVAALVLGVANAVVKPILQYVAETMTCVLSCLTLGLWSLVLSWGISALLFWACGRMLNGFEVVGVWPALWGALVMSCVNTLVTVLTRKEDEK